jgi:tetratricopeptide (TPR) repeat protein
MLAGCKRSPEVRRDKYIAAGKQFLKKDDYARAILQFQNAAQVLPKDAETHYQLGLAYVASKQLQSAFNSFRHVLTLDPKHTGAQLQLAQIMASTANPDILKDAEARLNSLLQATPQDASALHTLALTELKLGNIDSATDHLTEALKNAPQYLVSSVLLAQAKIARRDFSGAEEILKKACYSDRASVDARLLLGDFYLSMNRAPNAEAEFRKALTLNPSSAPALLEIGMIQLSSGRKNEAEQSFKRLSSLPDKASKPAYALFLLQEGRQVEAIREFEALTKADATDRLARTRLVNAYRLAQRPQDASRILDQALRDNPKDLDALLQRSEIFIASKRYTEAEADLNRVLALNPGSAEVHYVAATLREARGEMLIARQELTEALRLNPFLLQVRIELMQMLLAANAAKTALAVADGAPESQQRLTPVISSRNWTLWALGDMTAFRKGVDLGLAQIRTPDLLMQDALWRLRGKDFIGARNSLQEALKLDPQNLRALNLLGRSYRGQGQMQVGVEKVKEFAARYPHVAAVQTFLGRVLVGSGDRVGARAAFERARLADSASAEPILTLVQLDVSEEKWDAAKDRLNSLVTSEPHNATAHLWLGNILTRDRPAEAIEEYQQVLENDPNNRQALNNLAFLLSDYANKPDEALKYAQKAVELAPSEPHYADTLGWILYRKGLYSAAIQHLKAAASRDDDVVWTYHLAMAYAKAGDGDQARALLKTALKRDQSVPEAKQAVDVIGRPVE